VLAGIVDLLGEATDCHACFVYLRDGERLRHPRRLAVYAHVVGRVEFGVDEGLTGWVARNNRPAFIRENALADPRMKYVPELDEERFQSMVAVPVPARSGGVLGVLVLHTVAPREFDEGVLTFLVHVSTLMAGAIENAGLYEEARRRVDALTALSRISREIAAVRGREELYRVACRGLREVLDCERCQLHLHEAAAGGSSSWRRTRPARPRRSGDGDGRAALGREPIGVLGVAAGARSEGSSCCIAVAGQLALALEKAELIERLTAENLVRDFFEALATAAARSRRRARAAGGLRPRPPARADRRRGRRRDVAAVAGARERLEAALRRVSPGAFCDPGRERLRAVLPLGTESTPPPWSARSTRWARASGRDRRQRGAPGAGEGSLALREAGDAARIARGLAPGGGALAYADLGAYRYLVNVSPDAAPRDRYREAVERLRDYDARRGRTSWRRSSATWSRAPASPPRRGCCSSTRTRCASGSPGSRSSPVSIWRPTTCCRSSSRSSSAAAGLARLERVHPHGDRQDQAPVDCLLRVAGHVDRVRVAELERLAHVRADLLAVADEVEVVRIGSQSAKSPT
jgi:hypothetical protein